MMPDNIHRRLARRTRIFHISFAHNWQSTIVSPEKTEGSSSIDIASWHFPCRACYFGMNTSVNYCLESPLTRQARFNIIVSRVLSGPPASVNAATTFSSIAANCAFPLQRHYDTNPLTTILMNRRTEHRPCDTLDCMLPPLLGFRNSITPIVSPIIVHTRSLCNLLERC